MNYLMWILVGFIFSKLIKDRFRGWWLQYNFLTSAALDAGLALCTIVIFLTLNLVCLISLFIEGSGDFQATVSFTSPILTYLIPNFSHDRDLYRGHN